MQLLVYYRISLYKTMCSSCSPPWVASSIFKPVNDRKITDVEFIAVWPTKDATSTTTVQLLSSLVFTQLGHKKSSLTVFKFARRLKNFGKGHILDRETFKLVWFEKFWVVAVVASFVGNPVVYNVSQLKTFWTITFLLL